MAEYKIQDTTLTAIADAIRGKTGGTEPIVTSDFPTAIEGISAGGVAKAAYNLYGVPTLSGSAILATDVGDIHYDGKALPSLPEWDKVTYPVSIIMPNFMNATKIQLYCTASLVYQRNSSNKHQWGITKYIRYGIANGVWEQDGTGSSTMWIGETTTKHAIWTNTSIQTESGTALLSASAPIPLTSGEPIRYVGDVPVYE